MTYALAIMVLDYNLTNFRLPIRGMNSMPRSIGHPLGYMYDDVLGASAGRSSLFSTGGDETH